MKKKWNDHYGDLLSSRDGIDVIDCDLCGFAHIIPLPLQEEKEEFYEKTFYETFSDDYIKKHEEDKIWWAIEHNEKYDMFDQLLDHLNSKKTLLDIGSGPGHFLKIGSDRGWDVQGIEPGLSAWHHSHKVLGLNVHQLYFKSENAHSFGTFDVVHLNNVLEHIVNPLELLNLVREIINKHGIVSVTVPNDFNQLQHIVFKYLKKGDWWVSPLQHINYFNYESLERLLKKSGFKVVYKTASFPMELFLLMGDDYIENDQLGRKIHEKRKKFEITMDKSGKGGLKRKIYDLLSQIGIGRQITFMAKKQD